MTSGENGILGAAAHLQRILGNNEEFQSSIVSFFFALPEVPLTASSLHLSLNRIFRITTPGVIERVKNLFRGYSKLILGFNTFLPEGEGGHSLIS